MNQCKRRNITNDVKIGVCLLLQNKLRRNLFTDRVASGVELARACCAMKLHKEMEGPILRNRHTGADFKPPHAALVRKATVVNG